MRELPFRQIHLDFHTSELIPDVGVDFKGEEFAQTLKNAHVNSINIFAKCHHGMSYYPSKVGPVHPSLKIDLLGEMIQALHQEGIRCPIYTTVVWDEYAATTHPEWLQFDSHGKIVGKEPYSTGGMDTERWRYLCVNTGYLDYLSAQVEEIVNNYDVDGFWFDIMMYSQDGCSCMNCIRDMKRNHLNPADAEDRRTHIYDVLNHAMDRLYRIVKSKKPEALVFFNGRQTIDVNPERSFRRELQYATHIEIESLPSGNWGYNHFPMFVRYNQMFEKEMIGMNGKFHKSWGDFGGYKNLAALEFECFNMLANGAKVCIGDQLHPRGKLDQASYQMVGSVFEQIEKKEPWCSQAKSVANIALMAVNDGGYGRACRPGIKTLEAAMQLLLEDQRFFHIIDSEAEFGAYDLIVFPDKVRFNAMLEQKVQAYLDRGGKILLSHESGLREESDDFSLDLGIENRGDSDFVTTYLRIDEKIKKDLYDTDYAMYEKGKQVLPKDCEVLAKVVHPYFDRAWNHFMSHQQTPADKESPYAAIVKKGGILYFAHPIFQAYKKNGNLVFKRLVSNCIDLLLGKKMVQSNLPSTARVTLMDQEEKGRRIVHILHYPMERRAEIDIIEDVIPLFNIKLSVKVLFEPKQIYLAPQQEALLFNYDNGYVDFIVPSVYGHQMIAIEK